MIKYNAKFKSNDICICIIDDTDQYDSWTKELVKNRADYTISNCVGMGYDVYVNKSVDKILQSISESYNIAVIISAGTEFINGDSFFKNIPESFNLVGHILDAGEGYYMLHPQCYILNLKTFNLIGKPFVGKKQYFNSFVINKPIRSKDNIHNDYTPLWIEPGNITTKYKHTYNGWNLIKSMLDNGLKVEAFDSEQRKHKHYLYTDVNMSSWIFKRYNYCLTEHVHVKNTGLEILPIVEVPARSLITPAAGLNWYNTLKRYKIKGNFTVKFYDYNIKSLDWIKKETKNIKNINFEFYKIDLLNNHESFLDIVDKNTDYIEFSNIFTYEPTAALMPLKIRLEIQNKLIKGISSINKNCYIHFDQKAEDGFVDQLSYIDKSSNIIINQWEDLNLPPWHYNS